MLELLNAAVFLIIGVVAVEICRRGRAWREGWDNETTRGIAFASAAAITVAALFETRLQITNETVLWIAKIASAILYFPILLLLAWPLLGASVWLGRASGWPVEGTSTDTGWRRIGEGLAVIGVSLLGTFFLKEIFDWHAHGGWAPLAWARHPPPPAWVSFWSILILFGLAAAEELFYRGVLLRWLRWEARHWKYGSVFAMLLSSVIFYLGHGIVFSGPKFMQCMLLGTSLAWISVRRGLWTALVVHWLFNFLVSVTLP